MSCGHADEELTYIYQLRPTTKGFDETYYSSLHVYDQAGQQLYGTERMAAAGAWASVYTKGSYGENNAQTEQRFNDVFDRSTGILLG